MKNLNNPDRHGAVEETWYERVTKNTYNEMAKGWIETHSTPDYWQKEFEIFSKMLPPGKVADIGCGFGRDYPFFRDGGYEYVGLDFSEALLKEAQSRFPEANFILANMRDIDALFPRDYFDGFWAAASFLHIAKRHMRGMLVKVRNVMRDNAVGFISVKAGEGEGLFVGGAGDKERFFAYYKMDEFSSILAQCGFIVMNSAKRKRGHDTTLLEFFVKCRKS